jgi:hypothetical protein
VAVGKSGIFSEGKLQVNLMARFATIVSSKESLRKYLFFIAADWRDRWSGQRDQPGGEKYRILLAETAIDASDSRIYDLSPRATSANPGQLQKWHTGHCDICHYRNKKDESIVRTRQD